MRPTPILTALKRAAYRALRLPGAKWIPGHGWTDKTVYDIPVLFQVLAANEIEAAQVVAEMLEQRIDLDYEPVVESWHLPNHKHVDGSDAPVRVEIIEAIA